MRFPRLLANCGLAVALFAPVALRAQGQTLPDAHFAYINSQEVLKEAPGAAEAQQKFNDETAAMKKEVQQMQTTLDSMQQAYQKQEVMLSPQAKEKRQQEIITKRQEFQQRYEELNKKANQRQQELLQPILDQVTTVIEKIRDEKGYTMVFDVSSPGVLAADPSLDITQVVINRLKQKGPPDTTATTSANTNN